MSTEWFLHCATCRSSHPEQFNPGEDDLAEVLARRAEIERAAEALPGAKLVFEVLSREVEVGAFFREHRGHEVVVLNWYGDRFGECAKRVDCAACGAYQRCGKPQGHEPPCEPRGRQ